MSTLKSAPSGKPAAGGKNAKPFTLGDRPLIWIDGQLYPARDAKVSVYDHGLLYGDGCFEGIRVYQGRIFKAQAHMRRIFRNAERLRLDMPWTGDEVIAVMRQCIEANGLTDGYIRLLFTRGAGTLGLDPRKCPRPSMIVIADQIALYPPELYRDGMRVVIARRPRTPTACLDPSLKSLNYLNNIMAKMEAIDAGCLEAIMLSVDGYVGECTGDNLFIVKGGEVFTSPLEVGMLDGITRAFVMQTLAPACGVKLSEKRLKPDDVLKADEIFLTGSAAEIIAVTQVNDTVISKGEGPVTRRLREKFRAVVTGPHVPED
ncbi:MAG: branched-chain-amino-acid transaminase [Phycisphaerales bacterium]|nr:branched-chain-amino-acid transaminase [Phycisphaerales bacterium]